jgi:RND family efflux transporter MFP subunit
MINIKLQRSNLLLLGATLIWAACGSEPPPEPDVVRAVKMVDFGEVVQLPFRAYPGSIIAADATILSFKVQGRIIEITVDAGEPVSKDQVLARLDPDDYEAAYNAESANVLAADAEYRRYQQLYEQNAVSLQDLEVKRRNFDVAQAGLRTKKNALDDTELKAPFSGRIAVRYAEEFQNIQPKEQVLVLQNDDNLEIKIDLPERDVLAIGQTRTDLLQTPESVELFVEIASLPGRRFPAKLVSMSTLANPITRTFEVKLAFDVPDDLKLFPGMTARVLANRSEIAGFIPEATLISQAVFSDESGEANVWIVDPATMAVRKRPVQIGEFSGSNVQIEGGLKVGDIVVTTGITSLFEGAVVRRYENQ